MHRKEVMAPLLASYAALRMRLRSMRTSAAHADRRTRCESLPNHEPLENEDDNLQSERSGRRARRRTAHEARGLERSHGKHPKQESATSREGTKGVPRNGGRK